MLGAMDSLTDYEPELAKRSPITGQPKRQRINPNEYIPRSQLLEVCNAYEFARDHLRKPLNTYLVINFATARGWVHGRRTKLQYRQVRDRFLKALRDWCFRPGIAIEPLWVYVDENPPEGGRGPHLNLLLHLPPERWEELRAKLLRCMRVAGGWGEKDFQTDWKPVHIEPAPGQGPLTQSGAQDGRRKLRYICKGASPGEIVELEGRREILSRLRGSRAPFDVRLEPQGKVASKKRAGSSGTLSRAVRSKAGWPERTDLEWMSAAIELEKQKSRVLAGLKAWDECKASGAR